jgi:hypothetical protein
MVKENTTIKYIDGKNDYKKIKDFFISIDNDFLPPLSERPWGLEGCFEKPLKQGNIVLSKKGDELSAVFAYYITGETATAELIGVAKNHRKTFVLYNLVKYVVETEMKKEKIKDIITRTWATNYEQINALEYLGFKEKEVIPNDIISYRTTIVYEANLKEIYNFFNLNKK